MIGPAVALRRVGSGVATLARLDAREQALLPVRATPKRRAEYAAGRLAAHAALEKLLGAAAGGAAVVPERGARGGRPFAVDGQGAPVAAHLSITHAGGLAAAAAAPLPVGIDLVVLEPVEPAFREEAFAPGELAGWEAWACVPCGSGVAACLAFAAKEAALKWLGTGLELPLRSVRVEPAGPGSPSRLGGAIASLVLAVRLQAPGAELVLEAWVAGTPRLALVALCGAAAPPAAHRWSSGGAR